MAKTLTELAMELKAMIIDLNSDVRDNTSFKPEKYNNLKLSMDVSKEKHAYVQINIGISEVKYNLSTFEKMSGSLGQDEKYIQRWLGKSGVVESLNECWKVRVSNRGKITDVE